jgi:excisionase family DNA binding protein
MMALIDILECARLLNLKKQTVYNKVCAREIPFIKIGGKLLFDPEKLQVWVEKNAFDPFDSK